MYIHLFGMSESHVPTLPCFCASLRRASRALTQVYEQALRPLGLRGTQFTVLQALSLAGEVPQGELGRILAMDSTTLTRTLEIMRRRGWLATRYGKDRPNDGSVLLKLAKRNSSAHCLAGKRCKRGCVAGLETSAGTIS